MPSTSGSMNPAAPINQSERIVILDGLRGIAVLGILLMNIPGFDSLADFEKELAADMSKPEFQEWYKKFIEHVDSGHREILKVVV